MCEKTVLPYVPVVFLTCAVLLNVNKWIYCLMHINFYSGTGQVDQNRAISNGTPGMMRLNLHKKILNYATIGVIALYLIYNLSYFLYGCLSEFDEPEYEKRVYKPL